MTITNGTARIDTPGPLIYAPDFAQKQRPFVRLSFGIEPRLQEAATRLRQACADTFV